MVNPDELRTFLHKAAAATYAGGGKFEPTSERPGFFELVYQEGDFHYRDSFTGYTRSAGMEVVRQLDEPIWCSSYGGGMLAGKETLAEQAYGFLKKAMLAKDPSSDSFRGPDKFQEGEFEYKYEQTGDVNSFSGSEEIFFKGEPVFFHKIIGGIVRGK